MPIKLFKLKGSDKIHSWGYTVADAIHKMVCGLQMGPDTRIYNEFEGKLKHVTCKVCLRVWKRRVKSLICEMRKCIACGKTKHTLLEFYERNDAICKDCVLMSPDHFKDNEVPKVK